jgi:hypothetical protein
MFEGDASAKVMEKLSCWGRVLSKSMLTPATNGTEPSLSGAPP